MKLDLKFGLTLLLNIGLCLSALSSHSHRQTLDQNLGSHQTSEPEPAPLKYPVWWHAPFWSGSGYSSEAINYVLSIVRNGGIREQDIRISQHGDVEKKEVRDTMDPDDRQMLTSAETRASTERLSPSLIICHSMPTNWMLPAPMGWAGSKCPPDPREAAYVYLIGRTMLETDKLPGAFVSRCNAMNEIWVPSEFSRQIFIASGVAPSKLVIVPEGVNTTLFDPNNFQPIDLPQGELVFGNSAVIAAGGAPIKFQASKESGKTIESSAGVRESGSHGFQAGSSSGSSSEGSNGQGSQTSSSSSSSSSNSSGEDHNGQGPQTSSKSSADPNKKGSQSRSSSSSGNTDDQGPLTSSSSSSNGDPSDQDPANSIGSSSEDSGPSSQGPRYSVTSTRPRSGYVGQRLESEGTIPKSKTSRPTKPPFRFLSTFKWEARKGWDVLLAAYLQEFTSKDNVEMYIITKPFMGGSNFKQQMLTWARTAVSKRHQRVVASAKEAERLAHEEVANAYHATAEAKAEASAKGRPLESGAPASEHVAYLTKKAVQASAVVASLPAEPPEVQSELLPTLYVVSNHVKDEDFPRFYRAVDAFVLPSRGEGWGRPHVEAMSMALPVISTNWSGIQAYLDEHVGYPIKVDGLVPTGSDVWWFKNSNWAQPSITHLRQLMRRVVSHPQEAKARGKAARERMVREYSPEALGPFVAKMLRRAAARIPQ